jgi:DHA1 family bicyclomycin/chloramphenicol resistance-like MFS transporter
MTEPIQHRAIPADATVFDGPTLVDDVFPCDAAEGAAIVEASAPARAEDARHGWRIIAILSALMCFSSISTDFYLPAVPAMGASLGVSIGVIELTISGYLIGFSLGQLLWGPIGDRYGRRIPIALGLVLFIIASAGCAMSTTAGELILWRVVQALGGCAGVVLARAMVRDLYSGERAAQMMSTLMMVMGIGPLLGPLLGGQILAFGSWRVIFWTLVGVGAVTLVSLLALPETLAPERRNHEPLGGTMARYLSLIREKRLMAYAITGGFFYGGLFAYIAGTPFAYITYYQVPPQLYGLLFGVGMIGIMGSNYINVKLVGRFGIVKLLRTGATGAAIAGMILAIDTWTGWGGLVGVALPVLLFVSMTGFIAANSIVGALTHFPERAGAASALVGAIHYGSGILGSALVGVFATGTPWSLGWVVALTGAGCAASAWILTPAIARGSGLPSRN